MPVLVSGLPGGPGPDRDTSGRDGRNESLLGLSAKRPSSQDISASLNKKRKAGSVEETKEIYNTTHTCSPIKQEPGKPEGDPCNSGGITEPDDVSIKQEPSTKDVPQVPDNDNGEREEESSSHSSRLGDSLPISEEEADSPDHDSRKPSNVEGRVNSSSLLWDVSESESDTSEPEEGSSYGESIRSASSLGVERLGTREPNASFRGPQDFHSEESDNIRGRRGTSQDQSGISRKRPRNMATNESNGTEQDAPRRSVLHLHDSHARGGSSETPNDRMTKSNNETTTTGKPRQRAPAKSHVSAHSIPRSWKTATPADKMLMKMKDRGSGWLEIRKAWQELTGQWPAASTLPNRYNRIKDNLTHLKSGDGQRLINAVAEVEAEFEREKWRLIVNAMERAGAAKYTNSFIQKKYDELSKTPTMFDYVIDEESSDAFDSDSSSRGDLIDIIPRLQQSGAVSTKARIPAPREDSNGVSQADPAQSNSASRMTCYVRI